MYFKEENVFSHLIDLRSVGRIRKSELEVLQEFNFGQNLFKASPSWIKQWAALCLEIIKLEKKNIYENRQLLDKKEIGEATDFEDQAFKVEVENFFYQKINYLTATVDYLQNFLRHQESPSNKNDVFRLMAFDDSFRFLLSEVSEDLRYFTSLTIENIDKDKLVFHLLIFLGELARDHEGQRFKSQNLFSTLHSFKKIIGSSSEIDEKLKVTLEAMIKQALAQQLYNPRSLFYSLNLMLFILALLLLHRRTNSVRLLGILWLYRSMTRFYVSYRLFNTVNLPVIIRECDLVSPNSDLYLSEVKQEHIIEQRAHPVMTMTEFANKIHNR